MTSYTRLNFQKFPWPGGGVDPQTLLDTPMVTFHFDEKKSEIFAEKCEKWPRCVSFRSC